MRGTQVKELPDAINNLSNRRSIQLYANENLKALPDSITNLKALEQLDVRGNPLSIASETVSRFLGSVSSKAT